MAVDELVGELKLVKVLVPELTLCLSAQDALADTRQRRRDDQRSDEVGPGARERLCDPASDVVAADDKVFQAELFDKSHNTARLCIGAVLVRPGGVLV
jgi:hypothetical protein